MLQYSSTSHSPYLFLQSMKNQSWLQYLECKSWCSHYTSCCNHCMLAERSGPLTCRSPRQDSSHGSTSGSEDSKRRLTRDRLVLGTECHRCTRPGSSSDTRSCRLNCPLCRNPCSRQYTDQSHMFRLSQYRSASAFHQFLSGRNAGSHHRTSQFVVSVQYCSHSVGSAGTKEEHGNDRKRSPGCWRGLHMDRKCFPRGKLPKLCSR